MGINTQFIIGDCKGNDLLNGRKGGHSLLMNGLCRDCDISPDDGDDTCIEKELICNFIRKEDVEGKSEEELNRFSYLPVDNCFAHQCFGGCDRGIHGATPAEILHSIQLGLCEYIAESLIMIFTPSSIDIISNTVVGIFENSHRQSERDLPNLNSFRQGLMSVKSLKAKERFARVYCLFLALSNSYCIKELCKKRKKKCLADGDNEAPMITLAFLRGYTNVIEGTILFHEWLKQDKFLKTDFVVDDGNIDCRAMMRIKAYLQSFKTFVKRPGNGLKTPKFHQMLHLVDYIIRHGSPMNCDGSRGENFGKTKIKDNAKLTNQQKDTLNFDIGRRVSEEDVVDEASSIFFTNMRRWPSKYCGDQDLVLHFNDSLKPNKNKSCPRYYIRVNFTDNSDNPNTLNIYDGKFHSKLDKYDVELDWGGASKTPIHAYSKELLIRLTSRLFIGTPNIGERWNLIKLYLV